jgi:hypothetical protein
MRNEFQGTESSFTYVDQEISSFFWWGGTKSTRYCGHFWPIVQALDDRWGWLWSNWLNEDWQGKPKYSGKTCPSAILSTTNPRWPDPGSNLGRRGGKPATNRLSYGAAKFRGYWNYLQNPNAGHASTIYIVHIHFTIIPSWNLSLIVRLISHITYTWLSKSTNRLHYITIYFPQIELFNIHVYQRKSLFAAQWNPISHSLH